MRWTCCASAASGTVRPPTATARNARRLITESPRQRERAKDVRSARWAELSPPPSGGQDSASHQNFGYRAGGRTSEVTVTHSEPRKVSLTRPSLREYAAVQRERYLAATRAEKGALLNEVVAVTGLHSKE